MLTQPPDEPRKGPLFVTAENIVLVCFLFAGIGGGGGISRHPGGKWRKQKCELDASWSTYGILDPGITGRSTSTCRCLLYTVALTCLRRRFRACTPCQPCCCVYLEVLQHRVYQTWNKLNSHG